MLSYMCTPIPFRLSLASAACESEAQLKARIAILQQHLDAADDTIARLKVQRDNLRGQVKNLTSQLSDCRKTRSRLESELARERSDSNLLRKRVKALLEELADKRAFHDAVSAWHGAQRQPYEFRNNRLWRRHPGFAFLGVWLRDFEDYLKDWNRPMSSGYNAWAHMVNAESPVGDPFWSGWHHTTPFLPIPYWSHWNNSPPEPGPCGLRATFSTGAYPENYGSVAASAWGKLATRIEQAARLITIVQGEFGDFPA